MTAPQDRPVPGTPVPGAAGWAGVTASHGAGRVVGVRETPTTPHARGVRGGGGLPEGVLATPARNHDWD